MIDITKDKLSALNTIALWLLAIAVIGWLCFKPDNNIGKETIEKLTVAVDKISQASENMNKVAIAQREWTTALQKQTLIDDDERESHYKDIYKNYDYGNEDTSINLNQLYANQLHESTEDNGSTNLRGIKDGTGKIRAIQKSTKVSEKPTH